MIKLPIAEQSPVIEKTMELCQTILDQPGYVKMKQDIVDFLKDPEARGRYERLCDLQDELRAKQEGGIAISDEEVESFRREEEEFMGLEVAAAFISAQRSMHKIEATIGDYVRKTFELGRVPRSEDFSGGCGAGCGCSGG
ncbi:MAG TPA: YlbF family regulator [Kiritimatiellia bacterium]|nr:YlbF family regulator [Kiritimatiellia bacterium]